MYFCRRQTACDLLVVALSRLLSMVRNFRWKLRSSQSGQKFPSLSNWKPTKFLICSKCQMRFLEDVGPGQPVWKKEQRGTPLTGTNLGGPSPFLYIMVVLFPIGKEDRRSEIEGDKTPRRIGNPKDRLFIASMYRRIDALLLLLWRKQREIVFDFPSRPFATLMDIWARWYGPWVYRLNVDLMSGRA